MKDIRMIVRIKNNRLLRAREKMGLTQGKMAELCGLGIGVYSNIENLKTYPVANGRWSEAATTLSSIVGESEEVLFPQAFKKIQKTTSEVEMGIHELPMENRLQLESPDRLIESQELTSKLNKIMCTLTPREEKVLCLSFGLHGEDEHSAEEIGRKFCVTGSRIKSIKEKAIRKLAHPSRSVKIKDFV